MKRAARHQSAWGMAALALGVLAAAALHSAPNPPEAMPDTLDLKWAIRFALENNFAIRQARERIRRQAGVEIEVRAREIPNVSASGSYTGNSEEISQSFRNLGRLDISLQARQVLYAGGGVTASIRARSWPARRRNSSWRASSTSSCWRCARNSTPCCSEREDHRAGGKCAPVGEAAAGCAIPVQCRQHLQF